MSFGLPHRHYARTDSTNTRARELAAAGSPHGTVVTAAEQTEGRGRQGRSWSAPAGTALLYSALLRPLEQRHALLPLGAAIAVCEAAEELAPRTRCELKWPNDVQVEGRKLAGILIEARPQDGWGVVGIGLNLTISSEEFPSELRDSAVSLFAGGDEASHSSAAVLGAAAAALSHRLASWVEADPEAVLDAWRERDALRGKEVAWEGGSGIADGVDARGYLLVVPPSGERIALGAGEIHLTRS
jgi:BirA family transcriptional regulator, biotin operon repressor / biotin---[acetyl-CoA-carboxylase] ligase